MTKSMVNVEFTLPKFSVTKSVMWKYHLDDSTNDQYNIIIGRDLLRTLGINREFSDNTIE